MSRTKHTKSTPRRTHSLTLEQYVRDEAKRRRAARREVEEQFSDMDQTILKRSQHRALILRLDESDLRWIE